MAKRSDVFTRIESVKLPSVVDADPQTGRNEPFTVVFQTDGIVPFPQVIIRANGAEHIVGGSDITLKAGVYQARIDKGALPVGSWQVQVEGCRLQDWRQAAGDQWIKWFGEIRIVPRKKPSAASPTRVRVGGDPKAVRLYFGIHKHMHQPFYRAADPTFWNGEIDGIFGSRCGAYTSFIPDAVWQYVNGGLPHAGMSTSWSGSLIEQLDRASNERLCGGCFSGWNHALRGIAGQPTKKANPRVSFSSFGYFHPLMPLIPERDMIKQIQLHNAIIHDMFGMDTSGILFPPETAFHVRMIPGLLKAGVKAVMYDSIHRFRSCKEYPYAGTTEGMLPPNPADQENPAVNDWLQLHGIWAGSKISPSLLKPEYIRYEDVDGTVSTIIGIPAERYIGNEDARGGYGALQYEAVLGQVYDSILANGAFDPKHPPFFILHSDGDNHGGGSDSYYRHNTGRLVEWIKNDPRFDLTTIEDYLDRFPPDAAKAVHVEPGAWSGADNGDPQFRKWFSRYDQPYSPDLNSWAVLTALQNVLHSLEDAAITGRAFDEAQRMMLTAETSCYWYWTGQEIWDRQVTEAANKALSLVGNQWESLRGNRSDTTGPTIFAPWVTPENPGGKMWGQGGLRDAPRTGTVHTFVYDLSGLAEVSLVVRATGSQQRIPMRSHGAYPSETGPTLTAEYFTAHLPEGAGDIRFYIEATDALGNKSTSSLERVHCA